MNKKGISLVALVITIIVLIILTAAVIITGVNAPQNAQSAVANYNDQVVQDAVTIYVLNYIADHATSASVPTVATAVATIYTADAWTANAAADLGVAATTLANYTVGTDGKVAKK